MDMDSVTRDFGNRARVVLVLSGWTDGPLRRSIREYESAHSNANVEFVFADIPTPPVGFSWLVNPPLLLFVVVLFWGLPAALNFAVSGRLPLDNLVLRLIIRVVVVVAAIGLLRMLIAMIVRYAIQTSISVAKSKIDNAEVCAVIGFSWGGGILFYLLRGGFWDGPSLLLAPTIFAINSIAMKSSVARSLISEESLVHAVCPRHDPFCPRSQDDFLRSSGVETHSVEDDHILLQPPSTSLIARLIRKLVDENERKKFPTF